MARTLRSRGTVHSDDESERDMSPSPAIPAIPANPIRRSPSTDLRDSNTASRIPVFATNIRKRTRSVLNTTRKKKKVQEDNSDATDGEAENQLTTDERNERTLRKSFIVFISRFITYSSFTTI